ncbi:hypothetical protein EQG63_11630 [Flavobacterium amnicola]|uniref:SMP-30/Gluconolactonase/LRE-like region domain-containing protein n=1 Tax=Flavobacterium amnicola TaxID=2506422 RepID=A0A4Q1K0K3_9FLAO|nr:hypothetical protein [Flavobacterium amnicola]RXR16270.1 hypothetical protein EQG63_11630 [Flavobacterium amnicola]
MRNYFAILLLCFFSVSFGQSLKERYNLSTKAYQDKDFVAFLKLTKELDSLRPSHPTYMYNLACAFALNGKTDESIATLKKYVLMNISVAFEKETDLESIKNTTQYTSLLTLQSELNNPVISSVKTTILSERDLHPEGLLYLKKSRQWLATSIRNRKIVSFDIASGKCSDWFTDDNLYSVLSIKADADEKILWVTASAMPEMKSYTSSMEGKSEVLKIDIKTKKVMQRFALEGNHVLGDLVVDKNGNVFISDSGEAIIFKISNDTLEVWLDLKKEAFNLQGLTFNDKQTEVFIADYLKGILRINVSNPSDRIWLKFPEGTTIKGIDGLVWHKKSLVAIHNGVKPIRLIQYFLNEANEIINHKVLDNNRPEFNEPALGTLVGNKFYFFSNAPWKAYDKNGVLDESIIDFPTLYYNPLP